MFRLTLAAFLVLAFVPSAAADAAPGVPPGDVEFVSYWRVYQNHAFCTSNDAGQELALGSFVETEPVPDGSRYRFHLVTPSTDACPARIHLEFVSSLVAWPAGGIGGRSGDVRAPCGVTGTIEVESWEDGRFVRLALDVPAACEAGVVGEVDVGVLITFVRPYPYLVCSPLGTGCAGVVEADWGDECATGGTSGQMRFAPHVLAIGRMCGDEDRAYVHTVGAEVYGTEDECTARVILAPTLSCPAAVGGVLVAVPWGHLLP